MRIEFKSDAVSAPLTRAAVALGDPTPLHQDIGEYMIGATRGRFARGEAPDGSKWLPKSAATLANYIRRGDGIRPHPLIGPSRRLGSEVQALATRGEVEIGSNLAYAGVMQSGAARGAFGQDSRNHPIPWGDIPARVWLGLSTADETAIVEIADEFLAGAVDEGGTGA